PTETRPATPLWCICSAPFIICLSEQYQTSRIVQRFQAGETICQMVLPGGAAVFRTALADALCLGWCLARFLVGRQHTAHRTDAAADQRARARLAARRGRHAGAGAGAEQATGGTAGEGVRPAGGQADQHPRRNHGRHQNSRHSHYSVPPYAIESGHGTSRADGRKTALKRRIITLSSSSLLSWAHGDAKPSAFPRLILA